MTEDPGFWKEITGWLWALLALPLATVYRKANSAVQKQDMREHLDDDKALRAEFRSTMRDLFRAAEEDRRRADDRFSAMQENIHKIHTDLLNRLGER